ncbi:unnamed protein product [Orchesella dallaii]
MSSQKVWVSEPKEGFVLGFIIDLGSDRVTVSTEKKIGSSSTVQVPYESVYPAEDDSEQDYDDNCSLMYLNEATLLNNIRIRFNKNQIYTYIANMLIAVNPYVDIKNLYSRETIKRYQGKSLGTLPPHVFAIGDKSFRDMKTTKQSQSIIVSGESGAGKTESTKYILRYLCESWGSAAGPIEQKILDANPVLESFGNAKTTRNNNSSRFGKFIEIHFEQMSKVTGGYISHYLLEKSRICSQSSSERNYHIFYQLMAGGPSPLKQKLGLEGKTLKDFRYLNRGLCEFFGQSLSDPIVHDIKDFQNLEKSLEHLEILAGDRLSIYTVVASVLHLGNVDFEDDPDDTRGGCRVKDATESSLKLAASLIGVDIDELRTSLTSRVMQTAKGGLKGTVIMVPLKTYEAANARDALAKAMYSRLFDYIVSRINQSIPFKSLNTTYIGVLDIAGFEYFTINSFEQFCINYCNEKLQQFFNERVLSDEQNLYEKEQLGVPKIEYIDNSDCIELIERNPRGILSILDEESKLPKPTAGHFTSEIHKQYPNHFRLALPRKSKIKEHREIRDDEGFLVRHFAGAVCYSTAQFIEKNNDALHASLEGLVQEQSGNQFLKGLFGKASTQVSGKLVYVSVASKFRSQLAELLDKLRGTGTSFIRCIKPNAKMIQGVFEGGQILSQLQSAGMTSVLELMQRGYPSRVQFSSLYSTYKGLLPPKLSNLDPRFFCRALFKALGLSEEDFKFGLTRVFFRPGKFKEFDQIMRTDPESLKQMVSRVTKWILHSKWKKSIYGAVSVIKLKNKIVYRRENLLVIQKTVRMYLAKKKHRPRIQGLNRIRNLNSQVQSLEQTAQKLKKNKEAGQGDVKKLQADLIAATQKIKSNPNLGPKEIEKLCQDLFSKCEMLVKSMSQRAESERIAEEQERARKVREEMERQKREKEEQERARILEEENRKKKAEIEARRKKEEAEMAIKLKTQKTVGGKSEEDHASIVMLEQDKRDTELAMRLAAENNATVDYSSDSGSTGSGSLRRNNAVINSRAGKKHDLSGWKYSELRDTINTSCDVELLEACREEFHRRLKVYHAWKARNSSRNSGISAAASRGPDIMEEQQRAPKSVYQHQHIYPTSAPSPTPSDSQRYFRIPFTKDGQNKGLWYAHFDGQFIARQMEIPPSREATLLIAGRDDMQMCELKLNETGLTRKRGAEILEYEFEKEWSKHGGERYIRPAERASLANK